MQRGREREKHWRGWGRVICVICSHVKGGGGTWHVKIKRIKVFSPEIIRRGKKCFFGCDSTVVDVLERLARFGCGDEKPLSHGSRCFELNWDQKYQIFFFCSFDSVGKVWWLVLFFLSLKLWQTLCCSSDNCYHLNSKGARAKLLLLFSSLSILIQSWSFVWWLHDVPYKLSGVLFSTLWVLCDLAMSLS